MTSLTFRRNAVDRAMWEVYADHFLAFIVHEDLLPGVFGEIVADTARCFDEFEVKLRNVEVLA